MRTSVALRAAVIGSTAILLYTPFSAFTASAAPVDTAAPKQLSADQLPAELTEAIQRDLHISPQDYLDRAAEAQNLGSYAKNFRAAHPQAFAGAFMGQDGSATVAVTSTEAAAIAARDGFKTRMAPISADGLENSLAELNRWVSKLPREASSQVNSVAIDLLNNQIVVDIANSPIGRVLNLPTVLANVKVILSPGAGGPFDPTPMGGDTYITAKGPLKDMSLAEIGICSFGFNGTDVAGNAINITAGHCNPNVGTGTGAAVYGPVPNDLANSPQIGTFAKSTLGNGTGLDYSLIKLNDTATKAGLDRPYVRGGNGKTVTVTGTAVPVIGAPVCKSGQTSTFTCGIVAADHVETQLYTEDGTSQTVRGFASTACTLAGDSGGAIVSGTLALGITSGSNAALAPNCNEANRVLAPEGGTASLGIPIREILADATATSGGGVGSGLSVRTGNDAS